MATETAPLSSDATAERERTSDVLKPRVDEWFINRGVPQFVSGYRAENVLPALGLLIVVFAVQMSTLTWLGYGIWDDTVLPIVVMLGALPALPIMRAVVTSKRVSRRQLGLSAVPILVEAYVLWRSELPPAYASPWVECVVVVLCLLIAINLFRVAPPGQEWARLRWQRGIEVALAVVIVLIALEDLGTHQLRAQSAELLGAALGTGLADNVALVPFTLIVLIAASRVAAMPEDRPETDGRSRFLGGSAATAPALALLLATQLSLVPLLPTTQTFDGIAALVVLTAVLVAGVVSTPPISPPPLPSSLPSAAQAHPTVVNVGFGLFTLNFLGLYPLLVWLRSDIDRAGSALLVNLGCLLVVGATVRYGLDRIASWAVGRAFRNGLKTAATLAHGLPVLIIFVAFLGITAEVWQLAAVERLEDFLVIPLFLAVMTAVYLAIQSDQQVKDSCCFASWDDIVAAARRRGENDDDDPQPATDPVVEALVSADTFGGSPPGGKLKLKLGFRERINALAVVLVYQALIFIPVAVVTALVFLGLGYLAISPALLEVWEIPAPQGRAWTEPELKLLLWAKVAVLLAAFSVLYLAVYVTTSREQRDVFFAGTDEGIRQRLAVRFAYGEMLERRER